MGIYTNEWQNNFVASYGKDVEECLTDYAYDIILENRCGRCETVKKSNCEEIPPYCETFEEAMKSAYTQDKQMHDTLFDELDELESIYNLTLSHEPSEELYNCIPHGFITRIQFMDESGYIYPTCGNEDLNDEDECFGKELKEGEYIPVEIMTKTQFNDDDTVDLVSEYQPDNISLIDLVEEVPDEYQRIRLVGYINVEKEVLIDGEKCKVNVRERFDRITMQETHFN